MQPLQLVKEIRSLLRTAAARTADISSRCSGRSTTTARLSGRWSPPSGLLAISRRTHTIVLRPQLGRIASDSGRRFARCCTSAGFDQPAAVNDDEVHRDTSDVAVKNVATLRSSPGSSLADELLATLPPVTLATLRPYQLDVLRACLSALDRGVRRMGVSSPTGSGKTVMFSHLIPLLLRRHSQLTPGNDRPQALVLVGNIELALQASTTLRRLHPHLSIELEQGARHHATGNADVTVATYQSVMRDTRLSKFRPERFACVIVDEAHHAVAPSYLKLLHHFNCDVRLPSATPTSHPCRVPIIGFTATFSRHDQLALSHAFEEVVFHQDVVDMLAEGWLAPARFTTVKAELKLAEARISASTGDFTTASLGKVVNTPDINELVVRTYLDRARDRRSTLVFCVDLAHVSALTNAFRARGIDARWISSESAPAERHELVRAFREGEFPVLVNCEILTEGTDIPTVDCIVVARPTRSRNLFSQMIGRGLRNAPGKSDCRVIDFVDNLSNVQGLVSAPTLFGLEIDDGSEVDDETVESLKDRAAADAATKQMSASPDVDAISYTDNDDPFSLEDAPVSQVRRQTSRLSWIACGDDKYVLESMGYGYFSIVKQGATWAVRHAMMLPVEVRSKSPYSALRVYGRTDDLGQAITMGDRLAERLVPKTILPQLFKWAAWRKRPATHGQRELLRKMGFEDDDNVAEMTAGKVAALLTAMKHGARTRKSRAQAASRRATEKRQKRLARHTVKVGKLS